MDTTSTSETTNQEGTPKRSVFDDLTREELVNKCKALLALAQKAKQAKTELLSEVESYKIKLDACETEKKSSQANVQTLQELVDSLTEQKLNYITELDSAQSKVKSLNVKCNNYDEEIKKYKTDLIIKDKHVCDVTQKLSDLDSEIISLKRQNNRLIEENEQLINQLTELEARTSEFNEIGLQQREQLKILEDKVQTDDTYKVKVEELNNTIKELESQLQATEVSSENEQKLTEYENKIKEVTELYESEKAKKEKANIRLRSYKDKILKCAACINQLKNARFILSKTVKEYSENIPKWQNDILKASQVLDDQINELNNENKSLKEKLQQIEKQLNITFQNKDDSEKYSSKISELSNENKSLNMALLDLQKQLNQFSINNNALNNEFSQLKSKYEEVKDNHLPAQINDNKFLRDELNELKKKMYYLSEEKNSLELAVTDLQIKNQDLNNSLINKPQNTDTIENLNLQIKALESEKSSLVKEKLNARDNVVELEHQNKILTDQVQNMRSEIQTMKSHIQTLSHEKSTLEANYKSEKNGENKKLKSKMAALQEQYDVLKKEYDNVQDLNGLLKEEVETLKLSLEQPKEDENQSDLNVSLQTDIVKLETKLAAYKQENASLLSEVKESRTKVKEYDALASEYEDMKSKLAGYKTENTELLNEMKEINQVLKERGEAISKLQKAVAEMERLIETLEKDRDKVNQEKDDLSKKVETLENDLKKAEQKTSKSTEATELIIVERDNALKCAAEKEALIASLKDEIEKLKQQQTSSVDLPNEDMSTSTISKAEEHSRMKDLDETFEDKYTKLRLFALKLKKKLNETTTELQNAVHDKARLEKILKENGAENKSQTQRDDEVDSPKKEDFTKVSDLEMKVKTLADALDASKKVAIELEKLKAELSAKSTELATEIEAHKVTKDNLEKARRDVKKKSVLSLEMEDYERSMKELTVKMEESKKKMVQMESTIDTQEGTINAMKTQIKLLEEQIKTEETQKRLIKEELQHSIEECREKDNVIQVKNEIISRFEQELEDEKRKNEETDLEMTTLLGEKETVIMSLGEDKAELNNKLKRLEFKCAELNEKLRITNIELADLKTEYTSYKVRAQAVLRQNQTVDHSQEEQLKEEMAALKAQLETMTAKLASAQEQCTEQSAEVEASRRRASEAASDAARAVQRTTRLQADLTRLGQQLESERTQHKLQVSTLTQCYKTQISELEDKLQKETEALRIQLAASQEKIKVRTANEANHNQYMLPVIPKEEGSDGEMDINVSMIPREEGEGSESAPSPPLSKSFLTGGGSGRSPVPLERLLEEGVPEDEALDTSSLALTPDQEISDLRRKLLAQQQRVKHVTVLLSESERECARMAQLSELLKAELRRVRGATHNAHNTEYMKNVTLKFLTLPPGDERSRLVPVLQKILTLTSDETQKINAIAKGLDPNPSKGWGSYLPWPGGK